MAAPSGVTQIRRVAPVPSLPLSLDHRFLVAEGDDAVQLFGELQQRLCAEFLFDAAVDGDRVVYSPVDCSLPLFGQLEDEGAAVALASRLLQHSHTYKAAHHGRDG